MFPYVSAVGMPKEALDTPALLVDLEKMGRNIARMASTMRDNQVDWRPHVKCPKVPAIAHRLLDAGAIGVTCAKLGEAEVMAAAGIRNILIANQVVGPTKISRLVNLLPSAEVIVAVDNPENVTALDAAARAKGVQLKVVIEVNTGMDRAGVEPGAPVVDLASTISKCQGLHFAGLMAWEAHTIRIANPIEKNRAVGEAIKKLVDSADLCRDQGMPVEIVSCGGTGTYLYSSKQPGATEIQAGGGIFGDVAYKTHMGVDHEYAMTVLATVTSRPNPTRIICDNGKKTMSSDAAAPLPLGIPNVSSVDLSAEHAIITLDQPSDAPRLGDTIEFVVGYSDTTVMLHDEIFGVRDGKVEVVWPILGRGKLR